MALDDSAVHVRAYPTPHGADQEPSASAFDLAVVTQRPSLRSHQPHHADSAPFVDSRGTSGIAAHSVDALDHRVGRLFLPKDFAVRAIARHLSSAREVLEERRDPAIALISH